MPRAGGQAWLRRARSGAREGLGARESLGAREGLSAREGLGVRKNRIAAGTECGVRGIKSVPLPPKLLRAPRRKCLATRCRRPRQNDTNRPVEASHEMSRS